MQKKKGKKKARVTFSVVCLLNLYNMHWFTFSVINFACSISPEATSCLVYVFVSLARWLAGYEILAFEKPCLHYHKISTEFQLIYTSSKMETNQ